MQFYGSPLIIDSLLVKLEGMVLNPTLLLGELGGPIYVLVNMTVSLLGASKS